MAKLKSKWSAASEYQRDTVTGDGSTTAYVTSQSIQSAVSVFVFVNGLLRRDTTDYSVNTGTNTIVFTTAPATASHIEVRYFKG